jgi:hypothetical protein
VFSGETSGRPPPTSTIARVTSSTLLQPAWPTLSLPARAWPAYTPAAGGPVARVDRALVDQLSLPTHVADRIATRLVRADPAFWSIAEPELRELLVRYGTVACRPADGRRETRPTDFWVIADLGAVSLSLPVVRSEHPRWSWAAPTCLTSPSELPVDAAVCRRGQALKVLAGPLRSVGTPPPRPPRSRRLGDAILTLLVGLWLCAAAAVVIGVPS